MILQMLRTIKTDVFWGSDISVSGPHTWKNITSITHHDISLSLSIHPASITPFALRFRFNTATITAAPAFYEESTHVLFADQLVILFPSILFATRVFTSTGNPPRWRSISISIEYPTPICHTFRRSRTITARHFGRFLSHFHAHLFLCFRFRLAQLSRPEE